MTTDLEDQLARILVDRAETIVEPPNYRLVPAPDHRPGMAPARRFGWQLVASAAAVATLVGGVAALAGNEDGHRVPPANGVTCVLAHSSRFTSALRDGLLPAGSVVLATAPDGVALVGVERGGTTTAVDLVDAAGVPTRLWTAHAGERVRAVANPSGAVNDAYAAFVIAPLGSGTPQLIVDDRSTWTTHAVSTRAAGYQLSTDAGTAPVARDEKIEVLQTSLRDPAQQRIDGYWPGQTVDWVSDATASGTTAMLSAGGNLVLVRKSAAGKVALQFDDERYRPSALNPAARDGFSFSSDGTTLTWLTDVDGVPSLWQWAPGDPRPIRRALPGDLVPSAASGRYAVGKRPGEGAGRTIVDTGSGVMSQLPVGVNLVRVDGAVAWLTQQSSDGVRYGHVPVNTLTRC